MRKYLPFIIAALLTPGLVWAVTAVYPGQGGTGISYQTGVQTGAILYGQGSAPMATTTGTPGQVLAWLNGVPTFTATTTFNAPLAYLNGAVSITQSGTATDGYLSSTNFNVFNNKIGWGQATTTPWSVDQFVYLNHNGFQVTAASSSLNLPNSALANSSLTVTAGTGLSGGGSVSLGGSVTLSLSTPVTEANGGTNATSIPANMLLANNGANTVVSTSTPSATAYFATSTTATSTFAGGITVKNGVVTRGYKTPGFTYATTTAWTGTTTLSLPSPFANDKLDNAMCYTNIGTLNVQFGSGAASTTMFNASTTQGVMNFAANNTYNSGSKWYVDLGTPASSPTQITCTVQKEDTQF